MLLLIVRLLVDFGLVVLIWMVQLVIYPSFKHFSIHNLSNWHKKYTLLIGYVVAPLMLLQLGVSIYMLFQKSNLYTIISLLIIGAVWLITFFQFVPMHNRISKSNVGRKELQALVRMNRSRTVLWTSLFVYSLAYLIDTM